MPGRLRIGLRSSSAASAEAPRKTSAASWPAGRNPAETITLKRCSADHAPIATIDLDFVTSPSSHKSICVDLILAAYSFDLSKTEVLKMALAVVTGDRLRPRQIGAHPKLDIGRVVGLGCCRTAQSREHNEPDSPLRHLQSAASTSG